ncbi:MAG: beta-ketoacyl-ACP synthase II [Bacteroidales bacterium]|nr:beta-ketoacyl-ACP synthase II [Bacteroidales bacterium]MCL2738192.1 beta-ketoacyl-ACP synthase II [Bacteroidales bacterium]
MQLRRVVITGIGTINPLGHSIDEYFTNLINGVSGAGPITRFDSALFKTNFACEVKNYDPSQFGIDRKEERKLDLFTQFALISAAQAVEDSLLDVSQEDVDRIGVIWGTGIGGIDTLFQEIKGYVAGGGNPRFSPYLIPKMIPDIAAGLISMKYGFRGPNFATVSACASSTNAMADAFNYIRFGKADIIVTGGSEAGITPPSVGGFNSSHALSTRNDDILRASRPFDKTRDGFVMGEGGSALVFEEYEHAVARGAKIYAEVGGCGMSADAYHITASHPEGAGAILAMRTALEDAGVHPGEVDYLNVHGTSTPVGDPAELIAVKKVFGDDVYKLNISATKSMTGHLLGAAGSLEALACICAMQREMIPPTINFEHEDPEIDYTLNLTFNKAQARKIRVAMSNNFGFGGHNATIILKAL